MVNPSNANSVSVYNCNYKWQTTSILRMGCVLQNNIRNISGSWRSVRWFHLVLWSSPLGHGEDHNNGPLDLRVGFAVIVFPLGDIFLTGSSSLPGWGPHVLVPGCGALCWPVSLIRRIPLACIGEPSPLWLFVPKESYFLGIRWYPAGSPFPPELREASALSSHQHSFHPRKTRKSGQMGLHASWWRNWVDSGQRCPHYWRSDFEKWPGPFEFRHRKLQSPRMKLWAVRTGLDSEMSI